MSKAFEFEANDAGIRQLLKSGEMMAVCRAHANATAAACKSPCWISEYPGGATRLNVSVSTLKKNNDLLKALR